MQLRHSKAIIWSYFLLLALLLHLFLPALHVSHSVCHHPAGVWYQFACGDLSSTAAPHPALFSSRGHRSCCLLRGGCDPSSVLVQKSTPVPVTCKALHSASEMPHGASAAGAGRALLIPFTVTVPLLLCLYWYHLIQLITIMNRSTLRPWL